MQGMAAKSIVLTGADSGIGRAVSELMRKAGCCVTIADLDRVAGDAVVKNIAKGGA